jgi:hypothetical protein
MKELALGKTYGVTIPVDLKRQIKEKQNGTSTKERYIR